MLKKPFKLAVAGLAAAAAFSMTSIALAEDAPADDNNAQVSASASDDPFATENGAPVAGPAASAQKEGFLHRGFYASAQADYAFNTFKKLDPEPVTNVSGTIKAEENFKTRGLGGRVAVGYDINSFFGVEVGGFMNPTVSSKLNVTDTTGTPPKTADVDYDNLKSYGADLVGKVHMAFGENLFGFVGAGAAFTHYKYTDKAKSGTIGGTAGTLDKHFSDYTWNKVVPEVMGGIGYAFSDSMAVTAQYSYMFGSKADGKFYDAVHDAAGSDTPTPVTPGSGKKPDALAFSKISLGLTYKF